MVDVSSSASGSADDPCRHSETPSESGWGQRSIPPPISGDTNYAQLVTETLRLHLRYQEEVIEGFNLCPWAKAARLTNNTTALVDDGRPLLEQLRTAASLPSEILFLILPTYAGSRSTFEELVARLIAGDAKHYRNNSPPFAMAAFHPEDTHQSVLDLSAENLVAYLRRSPNPTIQLVRLDALERVRQGEPSGTSFLDPSQIDFSAFPAKPSPERPSLRHRIAAANHATVHSTAGSSLRKRVEAILDDRRQTYRRLGLPPSPWELATLEPRS